MDQSEMSELISAYLDGEATPAEREAVERSLESSPHWRTKLEQFGRLSELMQGLPRESAPPELAAIVRQRSVQPQAVPPATSTPRSLRREWLAALAGMAVTLMAGFIALQVRELRRSSGERFASAPESSVMWSDRSSAHVELPADETTATSFAITAKHDPASESKESLLAGRNSPQTGNFSESSRGNDASSLPIAAMSPALGVTETQPVEQRMFGLPAAKPDWDQARIGDVLTVVERTNGMVAVVELVVVDMQGAGGQLELLLADNGLTVFSEAEAGSEGTMAKGVLKDRTSGNDTGTDEPQLKLVYVTAPRVTIAHVLEELGKQQVISSARLQPPVDAMPLAETEGEGTPLVDSASDRPATPEQAELSLVNEALSVGQNYGLRQQTARPVAEPRQESVAAKQPPRLGELNSFRVAETNSLKQDRVQADKKLNQASRVAGGIPSAPKLALTEAALSNSAVPMTMNPQTGEVSNSLNFVERPFTKGKSQSFQSKRQDAEPRFNFPKESAGFDVTAPADAASVASGSASEPTFETPIRVLFVVKQAETSVTP